MAVLNKSIRHMLGSDGVGFECYCPYNNSVMRQQIVVPLPVLAFALSMPKPTLSLLQTHSNRLATLVMATLPSWNKQDTGVYM